MFWPVLKMTSTEHRVRLVGKGLVLHAGMHACSANPR